jgi:hypothetical protein
VILDDLRCDGTGHDGCGARCRIYWKEDWLRKVGEPEPATRVPVEPSPELESLVRSATRVQTSDGSIVYRSQATELLRASAPVSGWNLASFRREVACGNVRPSRFVRVMTSAVLAHARSTGVRAAMRLAARVVRTLGLRDVARRVRSELAPPPEAGPPPKGLRPGQLVQIKSRAEIGRQLDSSNRTRGLYFDVAEMGPYCGREATVLARVERFIDEPTGKMVELKRDCYMLEGVVCSGDRSDRRWFCPRAIYPWWRENWLSVVGPQVSAAGIPATATPTGDDPPVSRE